MANSIEGPLSECEYKRIRLYLSHIRELVRNIYYDMSYVTLTIYSVEFTWYLTAVARIKLQSASKLTDTSVKM